MKDSKWSKGKTKTHPEENLEVRRDFDQRNSKKDKMLTFILKCRSNRADLFWHRETSTKTELFCILHGSKSKSRNQSREVWITGLSIVVIPYRSDTFSEWTLCQAFSALLSVLVCVIAQLTPQSSKLALLSLCCRLKVLSLYFLHDAIISASVSPCLAGEETACNARHRYAPAINDAMCWRLIYCDSSGRCTDSTAAQIRTSGSLCGHGVFK